MLACRMACDLPKDAANVLVEKPAHWGLCLLATWQTMEP